MAPDLHDATHKPHPLHKTGFICALPGKNLAVSSIKEGAEYGHIETQTPHELQAAGIVSAIVPLVWIFFLARSVTALDAAAFPCATDSSIGLG